MRARRFPIGTFLFVLFVVFTLLELFLLYLLAQWTSWGFTILLAIVSALVGSVMAKREGLAVLRRAQEELARGQFPAGPLADGVMILLGGALLVTPGLITDLIGFSTLVPAVRRVYARALIAWGRRLFAGGVMRAGPGVFFGSWPGGMGDTGANAWQGPSDEAGSGGPRVRSTPVRPSSAEPEAVDVEFRRVD